MKILFLSLRCPYPPHRGDRIRSYNFIKQLSKQHAVTLVYFAESESDIESAKHLEPFCERVEWVRFHRSFAFMNTGIHCLSRRPLQLHYWYAPQMQRKVNQLLEQENFELIHAQLFRMGQYVADVHGPVKVLDLCDSLALNLNRRAALESNPWLAKIKLDCTPKRFLVKLEERRVQHYEVNIMKAFDCGTVVARFDRDYLLKQDNSLNLSIVPMGVDLGYFQPNPTRRPAPLMLFTGTMNYFPNADAAIYFSNEILPRIRESHPKAQFYIVGNHPSDQVKRLEAQEGIVVTGYVPDVRPYFEKASVFVAPLRAGSGIQTKNLEAMAMGVPVVTTSVGAMGLEADIGKELLVADTPADFAKRVVDLLNNEHSRETLAQTARTRVETNYSWEAIGERLEHVYAQAVHTQE
ncbi:TIGR03087 family PEP-CTERM/XrtA system glycosyltransferase [Candidatus Poribacteria bacterium]|nr:TIGR03087 family PEP-CTERM/XrtA system glycosyltransferase [Candidatus Poribacteria bacterium]